jgi:hypothetical protein
MNTKEIMELVDKDKSVQFMLNLKLRWNGMPETFTQAVSNSLAHIGINTSINSNVANGVITKMEKKSKITF